MLWIICGIAVGCIIAERLWPANALPRVDAWWGRVILVNAIQLGVLVIAGIAWDRWFARASIFHLRGHSNMGAGLIAYFISTFIYYWWHRYRHESEFFWRLCHQLHHSARRIEIVTSFYKHPVEIILNSILSSAIVYLLLGCSPQAAAIYTLLTALAEFFYHWNIRTPRWIGVIIQRPESHRIHHQYRHHTNNFSDLPLWDALFGTLRNAAVSPTRCGFDAAREERFEDMLAARDVHQPNAINRAPLHFLPTCIGCRKRWACTASRQEIPL